jgi:polyribonucleotide 5'-hydroxyl-kinase
VVQRDKQSRFDARSQRVREYFYGCPWDESAGAGLAPSQTRVALADGTLLYKIGGGSAHSFSFLCMPDLSFNIDAEIADTLLPAGSKATLGPLTLTAVLPSNDLVHSVLAVSSAQQEDQILNSSVLGYVHV